MNSSPNYDSYARTTGLVVVFTVDVVMQQVLESSAGERARTGLVEGEALRQTRRPWLLAGSGWILGIL